MLPTKCRNKRYGMSRIGKLELFSQNNVSSTKELKFTCDDNSHSANPHNVFATVWVNGDDSWTDAIDMMRLTICAEAQESKY